MYLRRRKNEPEAVKKSRKIVCYVCMFHWHFDAHENWELLIPELKRNMFFIVFLYRKHLIHIAILMFTSFRLDSRTDINVHLTDKHFNWSLAARYRVRHTMTPTHASIMWPKRFAASTAFNIRWDSHWVIVRSNASFTAILLVDGQATMLSGH